MQPPACRSPHDWGRDGARRPNAKAFSFEFEPWHRDVPHRELLADLRAVARRLRVRQMTQAVYRQFGRFAPITLCTRFGSWHTAHQAAGLGPTHNYRVPASAVVDDIRHVARQLRTKRLSLAVYESHGRYSQVIVYRHFANWQTAAAAAGVAPVVHLATSDHELFDNLEHVWRALGRQPRMADLRRPLSKFTAAPYQRRFRGYQGAIKAFLKHLGAHEHRKHDREQPPTSAIRRTPALPSARKRRTKSPGTTRHVGWRLRYLVLDRDHFRCRACGRSPATEVGVRLQVDHVKPWSRGGETAIENLQTLCERCNGGKSDL